MTHPSPYTLLAKGLAADYSKELELLSRMTDVELERHSILKLSVAGFLRLQSEYWNERAEREAKIRSRE